MLVEITEQGKGYWDENMPETGHGKEIRVHSGSSIKEKKLFVLGLMYGAGPQNPGDLNVPWARTILGDLVESGHVEIVED
jgi:hypothetical protein